MGAEIAGGDMIYTDFWTLRTWSREVPRLLQGILALIIIKNVIFFVLLDSNVLVDCIEFLIAQSIDVFNPKQNKVLMV